MFFSLLLSFTLYSLTTSQQSAPAPETAAAQPQTSRPIVISTNVLDRLAVHKTRPDYPAQAAQQHLVGAVVLRVIVDKSGKVIEATPMAGPDVFRQAAVDAVRKWQYKPYVLNGEPLQVRSTIVVAFP